MDDRRGILFLNVRTGKILNADEVIAELDYSTDSEIYFTADGCLVIQGTKYIRDKKNNKLFTFRQGEKVPHSVYEPLFYGVNLWEE